MRVIVLQLNRYAEKELTEHFDPSGHELRQVFTRNELLKALQRDRFNLVLLHVECLDDLGLMLHLNRYYPGLRVILSAGSALADLLRGLPQARFEVLGEPYRLSTLEQLLTTSESDERQTSIPNSDHQFRND